MTARNLKKLTGCAPDVIACVDRVLAHMDAIGWPMLVTDGLRSIAQQQALYAQGRTTPGPDVSAKRPLGRTVTKADGVRKRSKHQSGRAVDCCFLVDGKPSWAETLSWSLYGAAAEAEGFSWGGRWPTPDKPHIELPASVVPLQSAA